LSFDIIKLLLEIKNVILDTLFPISCISCNKPGEWLCQNCLKKIPLKSEQVCPYCEKKITPDGRTCFECEKKYSLDGLLVAASYQEKIISSAIHLYKYRFIEGFSEVLGEIILNSIKNSELPLPNIIIPVPLHKRRQRWRGFNQAELLARYVQEKITPGFPIDLENNLLERFRFTNPQKEIKDHHLRRKNIENAFRISKENAKKIKNKRILLIDDVTTTGATIFECAKILKKSGASEVFASVIARQGYD
jgi:ComF family protein